MKNIFKFLISFLFVFTTLQAEENLLNSQQMEKLDFSQLQKEARSTKILDKLLGDEDLLCIWCQHPDGKILPYSQGYCHVNDEYCHVANYMYTSVITVLEGPNYGLQTTIDYFGVVVAINVDFSVTRVRGGGVIFKHYYPDCKIITGYDQVILLY